MNTEELAFVSSPLQALGLYEYCQHPFSGGRPPTIVLPWQGAVSHANVSKTLTAVGLTADLDCATWFDRIPRRGLTDQAVRWTFLMRMTPRVRRASRLLIGNYYNRDCRFLATQARGTVVLLDDGIATRRVAELRREARPPEREGWLRRVRRGLTATPVDSFRTPHSLTYFTFYDDLDVAACDATVVHTFDGLRRISAASGTVEETWFVGSSLVEEFGYPMDRYLSFLRSLTSTYGQLVYIPHRRERTENLARYAAEAGVELRAFGMSFEVVVLLAPQRPRRIVSTTSSVLEALPRIVGSGSDIEFVSARLPLEGLSERTRTPIDTGYRILEADRSGRVRFVDVPC